MDDTKWLTDDEMTAWVRFTAVLNLLPGALDAQMERDQELTHFDYFTLAMLSEAPDRVLRMTALAARTNSKLQRLSRVVSRLEAAGYIERSPCPQDRRATNARLTELGWQKVVAAAPGHVDAVRQYVFDALTPKQVSQLADISKSLLTRLDPNGIMLATDR